MASIPPRQQGQPQAQSARIQRVRYPTRADSFQAARSRWRGRQHVYSAQLQLELSNGDLVIYVPVRVRDNKEGLHARFLNPVPDAHRFVGVETVLEILEHQGTYGTLVRLVRQGIHASPREYEDIAEYVFRVPYAPVQLLAHDTPFQLQEYQSPMTPRRLVHLLRMSRNCTINLAGGLVLVWSVFHRHRINVIGALAHHIWVDFLKSQLFVDEEDTLQT